MAQARRRKKRSSPSAKKNAGNAVRGRASAEERARIRQEIVSLAVIGVGVFLIFALFSESSGKIGAIFSDWLFGVCGPMAHALPFFVIVYGLLMLIGTHRGVSVVRVVSIAAIFILFCIILAGRHIEVIDGEALIKSGSNIPQLYSLGTSGEGGGVLGTFLARAIIEQIGVAGFYIGSVVLVIVAGILLVSMPMSRAIEAVKDEIEETLTRREERHQERAERRARSEEEAAARREVRQKRRTERRELPEEGFASAKSGGGSVGGSSGGSGRFGAFGIPSFLGGKGKGASDADKRQNILDAVKNDETYGDFSSERSLEIEDTTMPKEPDAAETNDEAPSAPTPRRSAPANTVMQSGDLGKRPAGSMKYGRSQDDSNYRLPPIDLLAKGKGKARSESPAQLKATAARLEQTLRDFRVEARVVKVTVGPTVTRYEVEPDVGVKIQSIRSLEPDLALKLEVKSVRVVPMPGHSVIGIEAYNSNTSIVALRDMIDSDEFRDASSNISFALGKNISGRRVVIDLKDMPHLLIAGTTGSGKSVCINSILLSILYRAKPSEVKLILIDPKVVELKSYNDLPHLLVPVVTDPERAAMALSYAVTIMNDRYRKFAEHNVRNLERFNEKMRKDRQSGEIMPQIVIVIDELSDLMMVASAKVQESISRLAAMARAAGMHLIVATQQPLASILTSVIKANIPSRIAFAVSSNSSSRVILDSPGAERLHGKGDMLFSPVGSREAIRVQGALAEENEVIKVVNYVKKQMDPDYSAEVMSHVDGALAGSMMDDEDELFIDAVEAVAQAKSASVSMIQRRFRIGYNRAARLVDMMEERGIVAASDGTNKPRRLIMSEAQLAGFLASAGQGAWYDEDAAGDILNDEDYDERMDESDGEQALSYDDLGAFDDIDTRDGKDDTDE